MSENEKELLERVAKLEEEIQKLKKIIEDMQYDLDFADRIANEVYNRHPGWFQNAELLRKYHAAPAEIRKAIEKLLS